MFNLFGKAGGCGCLLLMLLCFAIALIGAGGQMAAH